jgi:hypothetical protein
MSLKLIKQLAVAVVFLNAALASALPFSSFDPRVMGMGGAGVAVADASSAPFFNPALLSVARYSDDFSLVLPTVGVYVADTKDLIKSIDSFTSGNYVDQLTTSVDSLNAAITAANIANINSTAATVSTNLTTLSTQLDTLNNKPLTLEGGLATVIGIPNKRFGIAFFANRTIAAGALFLYKDAATLSTLSTQASCLASATAGTYAACDTPSFSSSTLQSAVTLRGLMLTEYGFSISKEILINKHRLAVGISPKIVQAQIYDIPVGLNSPSFSNFSTADYRADYNIPNFDLGVAKNYRNGWRSGLVVKNVIPYFLDYKRATVAGGTPVATGEKLRLIPQSRVGVSYTTKYTIVAMDMDLYRNDPAGLENYTQYVSLGGELSAWNVAQLRLGYRADLVNSARNIITFGLGFSPFGVHADLAVAGNTTEIGAAFQFGFEF